MAILIYSQIKISEAQLNKYLKGILIPTLGIAALGCLVFIFAISIKPTKKEIQSNKLYKERISCVNNANKSLKKTKLDFLKLKIKGIKNHEDISILSISERRTIESLCANLASCYENENLQSIEFDECLNPNEDYE